MNNALARTTTILPRNPWNLVDNCRRHLFDHIEITSIKTMTNLFTSERLVIGSETGYACGSHQERITIMTHKGGVGTWREQPG